MAGRLGGVPRVLLPLLLLLRFAVSQMDYANVPAWFGQGWEDPVTKAQVFRALVVERDAQSAATAEAAGDASEPDDSFNWRAFEAGGGTTQVRGSTFWQPQPLQSWTPRYDAVRHGYFQLYRFDDVVTELNGTMSDHFFSITVDVNVNPAYTASNCPPPCNSTIRLSIYESMPADLTNSETIMPMINYNAPYLTDLSGGNDDDLETRRHRLNWGVLTGDNPGDGLRGTCTRPVTQLYIGIQCLQGFRFPAESCTIDPQLPPTLDDCSMYCPYTLTVRAIPRVLTPGAPVTTLLGPGQWQAFRLIAGAYDLLDVTVERDEYDNGTYPDASWRDGFSGRAWLTRDHCVRGGNVSMVEHEGYCPHGGALYVDAATQQYVSPHRFCSLELNYSYRLNLLDDAFVREADVAEGHGVLNDLGYSSVLDQIAIEQSALDASMHYPTQLQIRARIRQLQHRALSLSRSNVTWLRRWPMRMCTTTSDAGVYYLTLFGEMSMDPRTHSGIVRVTFTNVPFARTPLQDGVARRGCLRRGGVESFSLATSAATPERTSLGLAEVRSFHVLDDNENHASTLVVRRGAAPTPTEYDISVAHPNLRAAMSACDVSAAQTYSFAVSLAADASRSEVFFEIYADLEDSTRTLGDAISGFACCGQYKYYAFTGVSELVGPVVRFNVTAGRVKALYWRYDACPREERDVLYDDGRDGTCIGWCVLDWYRTYSSNLGVSRYIYSSTLSVPYGWAETADKRRGGRWYLGIQALDEPAQYEFFTESQQPPQKADVGCTRFDPYCIDWPNRYDDIPEDDNRTSQISGVQSRAGGHVALAALLACASSAALLHRFQ